MQDIHAMGGGGGHLFGGGGGGDRRMRPHGHQIHQAVKCPRCDSLNTKFCYYNNYNLSQPRHFCKSCRRYWTKGGVLRNVPVGGGCRKAKRSKSKPAASSDSVAAAAAATAVTNTTTATTHQQRDQNSNSNSSSESSSLTAANSNSVTAKSATKMVVISVPTVAEAVSGAHSSGSVSNLLNPNRDSKFFPHGNANCRFEPLALLDQTSDCGLFSEIGTFTSLMTSTSNENMAFGFGSILNHPNQQWQNQNQNQNQNHKIVSMEDGTGDNREDQLNTPEIIGVALDQTVQAELSALNSRSAEIGGFGSLDWHASEDQGMFDLPNAVDQSYWSQSQWTTDQEQPSLFLP